mmetsp:Transcript_33357/g.6035  ORF Transcript_33357/g.6035 Transcript_33357/m.6035 type:complete len:142 (+) Transcript_33357:6-431(+)
MEFLERKSIAVRLFIVASCCVGFTTGLINFSKPMAYTSLLLCAYLMIGSFIGASTEISPYILENVIRVFAPCLDTVHGKAILYGVLATFAFGPEMGKIGFTAGILLGICSITKIIKIVQGKQDDEFQSFEYPKFSDPLPSA